MAYLDSDILPIAPPRDLAPRSAAWTGALVNARLVEAFATLKRLPEKDRPRGFRPGLSFIIRDTFEDGVNAEALRDRKAFAWSQPRPSAAAISRMEEALDWPSKHLAADHDARRALLIFAYCKGFGRSFVKCVEAAGSRRSDVERDRLRGAMTIAGALARAAVPIR